MSFEFNAKLSVVLIDRTKTRYCPSSEASKLDIYNGCDENDV